MKKFVFLFASALSAMLLAAPELHAQPILGAPVYLAEEDITGWDVAFEGYSDNTNLGGWLGALDGKSVTSGNGKKLTRFTGEAPLDIVWQLETADADDGYPDVALYYLKNKGTGQYIGVDWNRDESYRFYMVETKEEAARLAFYSATEGGEYGGDVETATKAGVYDTDWPKDPAAITIVDLFRPDGRGFISNEADEKIKGVAWSNTTTNVWVMHRYYEPATGRDYLRELVLSIPSDWEEKYVLHTDPGCIGDSAKYQRFAELYSEAVQYESLDDGRCKEIYTEMNELYEWLRSDESLAPVEDGGYYYFFTANSAFIEGEAGGDFAIYAPDDNKPQYLGWKAFDKDDPRFIWQIKEAEPAANGDKRYSIRNVGAGVYINKATDHRNSQPVSWSSELETSSVLVNLNREGQWHISDDIDYGSDPLLPYHMESNGGGTGTKGRIVLWSQGVSSPSAWYIKEVPQEEIDRFASDGRQKLARYWTETGGNLAAGIDTVLDRIGFFNDAELLEEYRAVAAEVDTMLNNYAGKTYTNEQYEDVLNRLKDVTARFLAVRDRPLPEGYYRFQVMQSIFYFNDPEHYLGVVDGRPGWNRMKEADMEHVWKVTNAGGGKYYVQNMGNSKYLHTADEPRSGASMRFSETAETPQYILPMEVMNGQFYFRNGIDTLFCYDTGGHDMATNDESSITYYTSHSVYGGTAWGLIPVSDEEFARMQADAGRVELNKRVDNTLAEARRLYNRNTVYTCGDKLITNVSQLYSNNNSYYEGDIENLIDNNADTYWKSGWDRETVNETHYLRLETTEPNGFPDSVICYIEERNSDQYVHNVTKYRVSVSDDTVEWKVVSTLLAADISDKYLAQVGADKPVHSADPIQFVVSGIGGYKYVRFEILAVKENEWKNNHPVGQFAEFNLMPVTGVDEESSLTGRAAYKSVAADLFKAVQKAQAELSAGDATQETAEELDKAISAFNSAGVADSIVAMARLNIENLSPGDLVGDFPEEALDAYTEAAEAAIGEYEGAADVSAELIERTVKSLTDAYNELYPSMVKPGDDVWYVLHNKDAAHTAAGEDRILYSNGWYGTEDYSGTSTFWVTSERENISSNPKLHFVFKANGDGTYAIQNAGTGLYLGPESGTGKSDNDGHAVQWYAPASVTIVPFGSGQIGLRMPGGDYLCGYVSSDSTVLGYLPHDGTKGIDTNYAWEIKKTSDEVGYVMADSLGSHSQGSFFGLTEPYDMEGAPSAEFGRVEAYEVVGKETAPGSADSIITAYKLHKVEIGEEVIPAGTPYIYYVDGDGSGEYDAGVVYPLGIDVVVDSKITAAHDTVNGLLGCSPMFQTPEPHYGFCNEDSVEDFYQVGRLVYRDALIVPWLVQNISEEWDKKIFVNGDGLVNGVKDVVAVEDRSELVDVFSVEGVLLRRGVPRADATAGLAKGVYVVGRRKVLVR